MSPRSANSRTSRCPVGSCLCAIGAQLLRLRGAGRAAETLASFRSVVETENACALPGCSIKYDTFLPVLRRAQSRGYVKDHEAEYVVDGLRHGFTLGVDVAAMRSMGKRVFRNYPTAYAAHASVTKAIVRRVERGKTLNLGPAKCALAELGGMLEGLAVFPMGAVLKPNQSADTPAADLVYRPTDDHTRTGLNAKTVLGILGHSLNTYREVEWLLRTGYFLRVSDVEDAFLLLPLHPDIWAFMLFRWACSCVGGEEELFVHVFADFGARGTPGTFQLLMVRVIVQMARSEMVLTLPLVLYVDDAGLIGPDQVECDVQMLSFQDWSWEVCGVPWKRAKDLSAAIPQYYIGFWWNSLTHTRTLDESKLAKYLSELAQAGHASLLTLKDRQSLAGKVQRAIMTMPPGAACLLVNCYNMMARLSLPWHARRTSKAERDDYLFVHDVLQYNVGCGYYSYEGFEDGPTVLSDASKSRAYTGGGYVESTGFYDFYSYGTSAARKPIDYLEGDTVLEACRARGHLWRGKLVFFGIDNRSFQRSAAKGRSKAHRLNTLLKELFVLQIQHGFVLCTFWISSEDNFLADHLSRDREGAFLWAVPGAQFVTVPFSEIRRHPDAGRRKRLPADEDPGMAALRQLLQTYSSNSDLDGPNRGVGVGGDAQLLSISYEFTTIYDGLPVELGAAVDEVMDNRLAVSSRAKVMTGFGHWRSFCESRGWAPLLETGDKRRGGRMAAWVLHMKENTDLVYASISTYVWGMRTWHVLQHQADPCFGVMHWREFMSGVAVLTAVPGEPRKMFPLADFTAIMRSLDPAKFEDAQLGLVLLTLLFTFSRTECPCPKTWEGQDCFDPSRHWQVGDFKLVKVRGHWVLYVRFKAIKQDGRLERPTARGPHDLPFDDDTTGAGHDWVPLGDVPGDNAFSIAFWYMSFVQAVGRQRDGSEPMFLARDGVREYTYTCLRADLHERQVALGLDTSYTPHGIRVLGYNLSKAGNGEDITVAHGGWMSSAHDRYERFTSEQQLSIPANMLQRPSVFAGDGTRPVSRTRATRHAYEVPRNDDSDADAEESVPAERDAVSGSSLSAALLPPGFVSHEHTTPAGRRYETYHGPNGVQVRSRVAAWRAHGAEADEAGGSYVPFDADAVDDVATPEAPGPSSTGPRKERLSDTLRRLKRQGQGEVASGPVAALPFGATCAYVEVDDAQCGNPRCTVPSRNGKHVGACRFPSPPPRR